jgi:hypothetical protein
MNVRNNIFEGWSTLLTKNDPGWQSSLLGDSSISDIPSLEEGETEGQIFIGNQIRQGL